GDRERARHVGNLIGGRQGRVVFPIVGCSLKKNCGGPSMAWIKTVGLKDPAMSNEIAAALNEAGRKLPSEYCVGEDIANILKTHTLDPEALRTAFSAGLHLIAGPSPLS